MKNFNIIINGVGGQGVITMLSLIDEAAFVEGYDVKSSELHGLSQRGGSVETHIRFCLPAGRQGEKINSPLIPVGKADLIISLEMLEALRESAKAGKNTKFLVNDYTLPFEGATPKEEIKNRLGFLKNKTFIVPASEDCKEKLQNEVVCTTYLLGYAVGKNLIPICEDSFLKAMENIIPEKYRQLNINAFKLGHDK